jgi:hypothetical protein
LIRTPGRWRVAGVNFGSRTQETTGRVGRKNALSRDDWLASLDPGIAPYVDVLDASGIETFESCEGSEGHGFLEPTVRFYGDNSEGFRALAVAVQRELPVAELRRYWQVSRAGEPEGPHWELTFRAAASYLQTLHNGRPSVPRRRSAALISFPRGHWSSL